MQRFSPPVLQALQRQGTEQEEGRRSGGKETTTGQQATDGRTRPEKRQGSFSFTSDGPHSSPTPTPPSLDREASGYTRLSRPQVPRGGRGGTERRDGGDTSPPEISVETAARIRPTAGSRALGAPPWESTAEALPPQLMGGRVETNAYFLGSESAAIAVPQPSGKLSKQQASPIEQVPAYLSPNWMSRQDTDPKLPDSNPREHSIPNTPGSGHSGSSRTSKTKSSGKSNASSFAYLLRDNRNDLRLFKKSSRPSQHLRKPQTPAKQPPEPRRSSSYYKPKVVEDSAALLAPAPSNASPEPSPGLKPPTPASNSSATAIRKARSSPSQSGSETTPLLHNFVASPSRHPIVPIFSAGHDVNRSRPQFTRSHIESSSGSGFRSRGSSQHRPFALSNTSSGSVAKRHYGAETPPEGEPQTPSPFDSSKRRGEHYFRTFGTDTIYQKADVPLATPPASKRAAEDAERKSLPTPSHSRSRSPKPQQQPGKARRESRTRSSIFGILHRPGGTHHLFHGHKGEVDLPLSTPDITISTPQLAKSRRRSTITSYFSHPRRAKASSDATPSPAASVLSTHWEDAMAKSQPATHTKEISEPLSPYSAPQLAKRPGPTPVQGKPEEAARELPDESVVGVIPSGAVAGPQPKYKSASGEEFYKVPLTGPNALNFLPSEMHRVKTPPTSKKPKGFKGFFFDMRSMPSESTELSPESPEARGIKRRAPIFQRRSMQSLLPKLSLSKLKRKSSQTVEEPSSEQEDPLAVTGFQQTPYSQRYGDARRAKMSQIRSYMEDALKEDDDDEQSAFPFVLNVPDHLPNSPLCPLSPKHKSGGKAICPYHGRKRATAGQGQSRSAKVQKQGPTIVFESGQQGNGMDTPEPEDLRRRLSGER